MPNPFDAPSTLPYQLPDFAKIAVADIGPALLAGMEEQRAEIRAITDNTEAPTFANTMEAWERSGQILSRAHIVLANASSADATDDVIALDTAFAPLLAAHHDTIILDAGLFARVAALFESRHELNLDADQLYLLERTHHDMVLRGAALSADAKSRLSEINGRLSTLETQFDNKLQADANDLAVLFDTAEELAGLSAGELSAAASAATERGHEGKYLVTLVLPANNPVIASMSHRESRERIMSAQAARGRRGGEHDTRETLLEIVRLRAERAELLGFANHQELIAAGNTAQTAAAIRERLTNLAEAATRSVRREHDRLVAEAGHDIASYDWAYYSDLVRLRDFDVDETALRPYFEAERVLIDGVFFAATALYGITFVERTDLVGYHPDTRIFEVFEEDGTPIGLYVYDLYTRDTKRGGAWMNELVAQNTLLDMPVVVVNNLNVAKPAAGMPTLLNFDEVNTLFHEFGHTLHGLLARVRYPSQSGTNVYRDYVEFPSQVNEMWMFWPSIVENYARHHETNEALPTAIIDRIRASQQWGEGYATASYLAAALIDHEWHMLSADEAAAVTDVAAFESEVLERHGLLMAAVPPRYSSSFFQHSFGGGYDAQYYAYIWSEVLDADAVEWFTENGGATRSNGDAFRAHVLGFGGSRDPLQAYRELRGRDADLAALLKRRGLTD
ncbi:peptidyl-dipeptidase Dcp [Microbacteriaceae bacterium MWH-Ta3]|nr:peptidyl-dipeptidase Dcp [Microbacteriaceae bacterium MWH-Ta3]